MRRGQVPAPNQSSTNAFHVAHNAEFNTLIPAPALHLCGPLSVFVLDEHRVHLGDVWYVLHHHEPRCLGIHPVVDVVAHQQNFPQ